MHQNLLVSVMMPVYNAEEYLEEAVESILNQTFKEFEFLIIDDGSTDSSLSILKRYAAGDKRIRLTSRSNKGLSPTLNEMLAESRGEFIARMDADDVALPERFAKQINFLREHPGVVCVGTAHAIIDDRGRLLTYITPLENDSEIQQKVLSGIQVFNHPSVMMRRSALLQIGGYDEELIGAEDMDLWLRLGEVGELAGIREVLQKYRLHSNAVSKKHRIQQYESAKEACKRAWQRRGIEGCFEIDKPWRHGGDRSSAHSEVLMYGWWAFGSSQRQTAILYALKAISVMPFDLRGWKLLACALIKPLPNSQP